MDSHRTLWQTALVNLRQQLTASTFNTWFLNSQALSEGGDVLIVGLRSAYAKDWLENRLIDVIRREVWSLATRSIEIRFEVAQETAKPVPASLSLGEVAPLPSPEEQAFAGFEPYQVNFVQVPKQFFEVVLRGEAPVVVAFVAGVISETVGVIVNYHTGERREWWEASYPEIGRVCGIAGAASVRKAIKVACEKGYTVRDRGRVNFKYRLRRYGEPI